MTEFSAPGGSTTERDHKAVAQAVSYLAALKNIRLTPDQQALVTDGVLAAQQRRGVPWMAIGSASFASHFLAAEEKQPPLPSAMHTVNSYLDAVAASRVNNLVAAIEGKQGYDPAVTRIVKEMIGAFNADARTTPYLRWPDPVEWLKRFTDRHIGPLTEMQPDGSLLTVYCLDGELHRDPRQGPARVVEKGERRLEEFRVKGQLHRPHADGPATSFTHYESFDLSGEEYLEHGKWHRPSELGPAVTHWARSGEPVMLLYYEHGDLHRDPAQGPAWWSIQDARTNRNVERPYTEEQYYVHGRIHRDPKEGPAILRRDNETGVLIAEEFWCNGYMHRDDGPSLIHRTPEGVVTHEHYYRNGHYRDTHEGPSMLWYDEQGRLTAKAWYSTDDHQRDASEGPGFVEYNAATGVVREQFFVAGALRSASQGPAAVIRDRDGKLLYEEFWDGEQTQFKYPDPATAGGAHG